MSGSSTLTTASVEGTLLEKLGLSGIIDLLSEESVGVLQQKGITLTIPAEAQGKQIVMDCQCIVQVYLQHSCRSPCVNDLCVYGISPIREPDRCKMCSSVIGTVFIPLEFKLCKISRTCRLQQSPVIGIVKFREIGYTGLHLRDMACGRTGTHIRRGCHVDAIA